MSFQMDLSKAAFVVLILVVYFQQSICSSLHKSSGELIKCGELCEYVDRCLNSDYYNESDFMRAVCDFMIQDIMHATDDLKIMDYAINSCKKRLNHFLFLLHFIILKCIFKLNGESL